MANHSNFYEKHGLKHRRCRVLMKLTSSQHKTLQSLRESVQRAKQPGLIRRKGFILAGGIGAGKTVVVKKLAEQEEMAYLPIWEILEENNIVPPFSLIEVSNAIQANIQSNRLIIIDDLNFLMNSGWENNIHVFLIGLSRFSSDNIFLLVFSSTKRFDNTDETLIPFERIIKYWDRSKLFWIDFTKGDQEEIARFSNKLPPSSEGSLGAYDL